MMLSKLLPRRRASVSVHNENRSAALASTRSSKYKYNEQKYNKSQLPLFAQSTYAYGKSIFLIGAVVTFLTFPLVDKKVLLLRHKLSLDQTTSNAQTHLREAISADGSLDTQNVAYTEVVTNKQILSEHVTFNDEKSTENNFDLDTDVEEDELKQLPSNVRYTHDLAAQAVEPTTWVCGEEMDQHNTTLDPVTDQRPFFAFVHVYKTAGSTVRGFFREYAQVCKKSLALVISCHGLTVDECKLKQVVNAPKSIKSVNSTVLRDQFDILGGHFGFGMTDDIFTNTKSSNKGVRHLVFLRQPMARYISHILYKGNHGEHTVQGVAKYIKNKVRSSRKNGEYVSSIYKYLLTPDQRERKYEQEESKEKIVAHGARLSIDNLARYNAIVGMTETFPQSMKILEQVMGKSSSSPAKADKVLQLFSRYYSGKDVTRNVSKRNGITSTSVMDELMKDKGFMKIFREFVKYEQLIVDFAMDMHLKQFKAVETIVGNK